jgi:hypothetical protein
MFTALNLLVVASSEADESPVNSTTRNQTGPPKRPSP